MALDASGFGAVKVGTDDPVCVERPFELTTFELAPLGSEYARGMC